MSRLRAANGNKTINGMGMVQSTDLRPSGNVCVCELL